MGITTAPAKNEVLMRLNKRFYNYKALKESLMGYLNICALSFDQNQTHFLITLWPKDKNSLNIVGPEFCNYLLSKMKNDAFV